MLQHLHLEAQRAKGDPTLCCDLGGPKDLDSIPSCGAALGERSVLENLYLDSQRPDRDPMRILDLSGPNHMDYYSSCCAALGERSVLEHLYLDPQRLNRKPTRTPPAVPLWGSAQCWNTSI